MLTIRGLVSTAVGLLLCLGGRVFGAPELYAAGAAVVCLTLAMVIRVRLGSTSLEARRVLPPTSPHVGSACSVAIEVTNTGRRRSPLGPVNERLGDGPGPSFMAPPIKPGDSMSSSYPIPTARRGRIRLGPTTFVRQDPFGLAATTVEIAPPQDVLVLPTVVRVPPPPSSSGGDAAASEQSGRSGTGGGDFHALRQYVVGDDMRRVHWRSTARLDELVTREEQSPRIGRAVVVLDVSPVPPTVFEQMVSAAASLVAAASEHADEVRFLATDGTDTGYASRDQILAQLAEVEPLAAAQRWLVARPSGALDGAAILLTAGSGAERVAGTLDLAASFDSLHLVAFGEPLAASDGIRCTHVPPGASFAGVWTAASRDSVQGART